MAQYTTQLRTICESLAEETYPRGYEEIERIVSIARPLIFSFDYPIFDETYKKVLETKIIKHFYMREIGVETYGLWKHFLSNRMNEIMPYYNQLYKSATLVFNPFYDVDLTRQHKLDSSIDSANKATTSTTSSDKTTGDKTSSITTDVSTTEKSKETNSGTDSTKHSGSSENVTNGNSSQTDNISTTKEDAYNDTPQNNIDNVKSLNYLSNFRYIKDNSEATKSNENLSTVTNTEEATDTTTYGKSVNTENSITSATSSQSSETSDISNTGKSDGTTESTGKTKTVDEFIETVKGKQSAQSYSSLLNEYRTTLLNIDLLIINELNDLFMNIY